MHIIPFGDRILVRRKLVGDKMGKSKLIYAPDSVKERATDLAEVVYIPEHSFADASLIDNAEKIIGSLTEKAKQGSDTALVALLKYNAFLKIKSINPGDMVMISKYVGTTFHDNQGGENLTLVDGSDIIGLVIEDEE